MKKLNYTIDKIDREILVALQADARLRNVELAKRVGLSASPCLRRVRRLKDLGVIREFTTLVDPEAVGVPVSVFIQVTLERQIEHSLESFEAQIVRWPEVMECYLMTGDSDYLLRVVAADLTAYQEFLMNKLTRVEGVASIKSSFALKRIVYRTALPVESM
ncbi:MAG: ArsR family transcriptional regulator [Magnetovibrio sp.]|nr:ArsR family transcriptional regulator [Magnetovibrio sp.]